MSKLRHPNIVQYYGTTTENGSICIFLELVKMGSLQSIYHAEVPSLRRITDQFVHPSDPDRVGVFAFQEHSPQGYQMR